MSVDIQVVYSTRLVNITSAEFMMLESIPSLLVKGGPFSAISSVTVNGVEAPSFYVKSLNNLVVQLPVNYNSSVTIDSIEVLSDVLDLSNKNLLQIRWSENPGKVSGTQRLIQRFLKVLLSNPGSSIFAPNLGGGLLRMLGSNISSSRLAETKADVITAVNRTTEQIIAIDSQSNRTPLSEKLSNAELIAFSVDSASSAIVISIKLYDQTGSTDEFNLRL